jgi:hypothetical protein
LVGLEIREKSRASPNLFDYPEPTSSEISLIAAIAIKSSFSPKVVIEIEGSERVDSSVLGACLRVLVGAIVRCCEKNEKSGVYNTTNSFIFSAF